MRVLVTGGCGFIGSNLVDKLLELNYEVSVIDNLATGNINYLKEKKVKFYCNDIRRLPEFSIKYDVIFHLAALPRIQPSFDNPKETISVNAQGTVGVLELARKTRSKVVYAGSSSFYFDPYANPYAYSKWVGEEHCKMYNKVYGVPVAIARFFNVYGQRHSREGAYATVIGIFERQKLAGEPLTVTGTGEQLRDFTAVEDICDGLIAASKGNWNGEIFNLGRGNNYSIIEVANMFKPAKIEYISKRPGEAWETLADLEFTMANLDWKPTRNLPDYIEKYLKEVDDYKKSKS